MRRGRRIQLYTVDSGINDTNKTYDSVDTHGKMSQVKTYMQLPSGRPGAHDPGGRREGSKLWWGTLRSRRSSSPWVQSDRPVRYSEPKVPMLLISQSGIHVSHPCLSPFTLCCPLPAAPPLWGLPIASCLYQKMQPCPCCSRSTWPWVTTGISFGLSASPARPSSLFINPRSARSRSLGSVCHGKRSPHPKVHSLRF